METVYGNNGKCNGKCKEKRKGVNERNDLRNKAGEGILWPAQSVSFE